MTVLVGILCKDGVVVGADSSMTLGDGQVKTIEQPTEKIRILCDGNVIVVGTGAVGLNQRFCETIGNNWINVQKAENPNGLAVARTLSSWGVRDFQATGLEIGKFGYGALVAFAARSEPQLYEFGQMDMQPEMKSDGAWYASMGVGQVLIDPFFALLREIFWPSSQPTLKHGIFAATWALDHAINVNSGGINGPARIAVLERENGESGQFKARMLLEEELGEHRQVIAGARTELKAYLENQGASRDEPQTEFPLAGAPATLPSSARS